MKNVRLLYNPRSGGKRRHGRLAGAMAVLREAGIDASLLETRSSAEATAEARNAVAAGCDAVFACGGDGTIHDVIQGLAGTPVPLGILPFGTANALAHDLGLPTDPMHAARAALNCRPRRIALGRVRYRGLDGVPSTRYFTIAAGVGVDAHLFYKLHTGTKQRLGMAAYYVKAWHLWMTYRMQRFSVEYCESGASHASQAFATELLAVRIQNFGGIIRELAPGASLDRNDLRLVICRSSNRSAYLAYVARGLLGARWGVPGIDLVYAESVRCDPGPSESPGCRAYIEADGELLGTIPAEIAMVPDALTLLVP